MNERQIERFLNEYVLIQQEILIISEILHSQNIHVSVSHCGWWWDREFHHDIIFFNMMERESFQKRLSYLEQKTAAFEKAIENSGLDFKQSAIVHSLLDAEAPEEIAERFGISITRFYQIRKQVINRIAANFNEPDSLNAISHDEEKIDYTTI